VIGIFRVNCGGDNKFLHFYGDGKRIVVAENIEEALKLAKNF
jgi:hypothetical protein